ncbi:topoisomerase II [Artemisia annua]|uniref:DNA topoisomerase (ATP-hydrolyzing) n=1 Tax=Artemisia annua TaxID=35608 RepID=A0A2U1LH81_ARTAN|nr:topoisomerase II [Artemisia annua]
MTTAYTISEKCNSSEEWTMLSFKPDLAKYGMECLEDDTVSLMKTCVVDLAGCLGNRGEVELNGTRLPIKTFEDYVKLYPGTSTGIYEKVNDKWEIFVCLSDGQFKQSYLWVFVNALVDNPDFHWQTKANLTTTDKGIFGSPCELTHESLKRKDLQQKYPDALTNLRLLTDYGATVLHGVDARKMSEHPRLRGRTYDFIIYNFPHAGFIGDESTQAVINKHRELVRGFFLNVVCMLSPEGQCHVTHKRKAPFSQWHIPKLAHECGLGLIECADFNGYV